MSRTNNPLSAFILDMKARDQTKGKVCTIRFNDSAYPGCIRTWKHELRMIYK